VKKGSKIRGSLSAGMPDPESATETLIVTLLLTRQQYRRHLEP
jgi:hypothetical protein